VSKQTFTVGQVLTAAQMTSLQQTAMGGGSTTAKTASYVLVAADAGTVVQMNAAGATTITVNTALFAAGDSVQIQNIGAGVCTVTAGTATVNTSSTLALKQYDSGDLYFNSTSAALFFNTDAADGSSPLTTKGDLYGFSTLDARIPIGTNNQVLTADSAEALGLKWATPAGAASGMTFIQRSTFSVVANTGTTFDGIFSATYSSYLVIIENFFAATNTDNFHLRLRIGATTHTGAYVNASIETSGSQLTVVGVLNAVTDNWNLADVCGTSAEPNRGFMYFPFMGTAGSANMSGQMGNNVNSKFYTFNATNYPANAYTGLQFASASSNISGTISVYGLAKS